jgi:hypothetical protein
MGPKMEIWPIWPIWPPLVLNRVKWKTSNLKRKLEDDLKKIKMKMTSNFFFFFFSIPLKYRVKPFLGLAQLSKIFIIIYYLSVKILESLANPKISFGFAVVFHFERT